MKILLCHLAIVLLFSTSSAFAQSQRQLAEEGRRIFFEETFDGNGRTCGTCHPAEHNFTIDPAFIAALPRNDPLFVAEFNPALRNLENPRLMRQFGLILENVDGLPPQQHVFRGVPHNIGMRMSIRSDLDRPGDATGWSGDGAPVDDNIPGADGSIRAFLIGGIIQHFPRTLDRVPGEDFRLPTDEELDAVEAFLLSLGRQEELDLGELQYADDNVDVGRRLFMGEGTNRACSACHGDAGANDGDRINANFDTGTRRAAPFLPPDGGFGQDPLVNRDGSNGGFGNGTMNVPSLIEAADTPPFFHNNSAATLEEAIDFYTSRTFARSPAGDFGGAFDLDGGQIEQLAAFLRAINAHDNIRNSNVLAVQVQRMPRAASSANRLEDRIREIIAETEDAIEVLDDGMIYSDVVGQLRRALELDREALATSQNGQRNRLLRESQNIKEDAADAMMAPAVSPPRGGRPNPAPNSPPAPSNRPGRGAVQAGLQ